MLSSSPSWWTPAVRMGLSISVATGLYGISFGALAVVLGAGAAALVRYATT